FSDPAKRRRLEAITHPRIRQVMAERIAAAAAAGRPVIAEIPLLFESEASRSLVDVVIVVYADPETQLARLMGRDQLTREQALARIEAQMPCRKRSRAPTSSSTTAATWSGRESKWPAFGANCCRREGAAPLRGGDDGWLRGE